MNFLHTATRTFCTLSFLVGIISQLTDGTHLHKCIKALVGLYILVIVAQTVRSIPLAHPVKPVLSGSSEARIEMPDIEPAVLEQCCTDLERYAELHLQQRGIDAAIQLELSADDNNVAVQTVYLQIADENLISAATEYLRQEFRVREIIIVQEEEK